MSGLHLTGRSSKRTQDPPSAWSTAHIFALFTRGSRCLQAARETLSCSACLQVAGQDAETRYVGLEWPGQVLEAVCDLQLAAEMLLSAEGL